MVDIALLKAEIRAILLSLGKVATEKQFRSAYYELNGKSFNEVLKNFNLSTTALFSLIPDVCRYFIDYNGELVLHRMSSEETSHMDHLTIARKKKRRPAVVAVPLRRRFAPMRSYQQQQTFNRPSVSSRSQAPRNFNSSTPAYSNYRPPARSHTAVASAPTMRPALHSTERVVYNNGQLIHQPPSALSSSAPAFNLTVHARNNQTVSHPCNSSTVIPKAVSHSKERVVYNQDKTVIFNGDEAVVVKKKAESQGKDVDSSSSSNEIVSDGSRGTSSVVPLENENEAVEKLARRLSESLVIKDEDEPIKVETKDETEQNDSNEIVEELQQVKMQPSPMPIRKTPNQIRALLRNAAASARIFDKAIQGVKNQAGTEKRIEKEAKTSEFLRNYVTKATSIPAPQRETAPPFFPIRILDILSPSKFTFQFGFKELDELATKMRVFYESLDRLEDYQVRELANYLLVAVKHGKNWFRAKIIACGSEFAEIIPLDCMKLKSKKVRKENIFYLHKAFLTATQKSAIGCIHGIKPAGEEWSQECIDELQNHKTINIHATVKKIEGDIYQISVVNFANKKSLATLMLDTQRAVIDKNAYNDNSTGYLFASLK